MTTVRQSSAPNNGEPPFNGWQLVVVLVVLSAVSLTTLAMTGSVEAAGAVPLGLLAVVVKLLAVVVKQS